MEDKDIKPEASDAFVGGFTTSPDASNYIPETVSAAEVSTSSADDLSPAPTPTVVEVPVDKLQSIMDKMDEQARQIEALNQTVSSTRLAEAKANLDVDKRGRVHFKKIDGKTVIGWPSAPSDKVKNEIIFNPATNLPMGEILKSVYYFADGTESEIMDQIRMTRSTDRAYARILQDEGDYVVVEFEDKVILDKPLRVHKSFLNA